MKKIKKDDGSRKKKGGFKKKKVNNRSCYLWSTEVSSWNILRLKIDVCKYFYTLSSYFISFTDF